MYSSTAKANQFLTRTASESLKGSRRGFDLLDHGIPVTAVLTMEQRRDSLKAQLKAIECAIAETTKREDKESLGQQKHLLQEQMREIRQKLKGPKTTQAHFMDICRERMLPFQFKMFMHEAAQRAEASEMEAAQWLEQSGL